MKRHGKATVQIFFVVYCVVMMQLLFSLDLRVHELCLIGRTYVKISI